MVQVFCSCQADVWLGFSSWGNLKPDFPCWGESCSEVAPAVGLHVALTHYFSAL